RLAGLLGALPRLLHDRPDLLGGGAQALGHAAALLGVRPELLAVLAGGLGLGAQPLVALAGLLGDAAVALGLLAPVLARLAPPLVGAAGGLASRVPVRLVGHGSIPPGASRASPAGRPAAFSY